MSWRGSHEVKYFLYSMFTLAILQMLMVVLILMLLILSIAISNVDVFNKVHGNVTDNVKC